MHSYIDTLFRVQCKYCVAYSKIEECTSEVMVRALGDSLTGIQERLEDGEIEKKWAKRE